MELLYLQGGSWPGFTNPERPKIHGFLARGSPFAVPWPREHPPAVDDLEKRALSRDRGFVARLVALLALGVLAGGFLYGKLTSQDLAGCAARSFESETGPEPSP
ncbi:MAG: hypothetical protein KC416_10960 [Myxococcales bacterium]|nr:hypothetical protein [Myxococcales bacterium]